MDRWPEHTIRIQPIMLSRSARYACCSTIMGPSRLHPRTAEADLFAIGEGVGVQEHELLQVVVWPEPDAEDDVEHRVAIVGLPKAIRRQAPEVDVGMQHRTERFGVVARKRPRKARTEPRFGEVASAMPFGC